MNDENNFQDAGVAPSPQAQAPQAAPTPAAPAAEPAPYVRQRAQHRSVDPIDDFAAGDIAPEATTHDSDYVGSRGMGGRSYRRSREQGEQLRRNLHYGQYLEIPKGRRQIFASRERERQIRSRIAAVVVIAVLLLATLLILRLGGALG